MTDHTDLPAGAIPTAVDNPEPLPVGANDPEVLAEQPIDPPGLPKAPDDVDRVLAEFVQKMHDEGHGIGYPIRLDSATLPDVMARRVNLDLRPFSTRQALLGYIGHLWERERTAARAWGEAVREREEQRIVFEKMRDERTKALNALFALGLDIEGDHEVVEPKADIEPIPDAKIV